jgi:hypothetical protein
MEGTMHKSDNVLLMIANATIAPPVERPAEIVLPHMRGACVNVGDKVHTLFRYGPRAETAYMSKRKNSNGAVGATE